jgi:hypothetical protein
VLFHRDPRWLGSDAAYSVPLGEGRILWLFNDTLLETTRSQPDFVRNTIAIERGMNPVEARMTFYWRTVANAPRSSFPEEGSRWFWPQDGIRLGRGLVVFIDRVRERPHGPSGFNFRATAGGSRSRLTHRRVRRTGDFGS